MYNTILLHMYLCKLNDYCGIVSNNSSDITRFDPNSLLISLKVCDEIPYNNKTSQLELWRLDCHFSLLKNAINCTIYTVN